MLQRFNTTLLQVCRGFTGCGDVSMRLLLSARASCSQSSILLSLQFCRSCNSAAPVFPYDPEHKMDCTPLGHIGCGLALSYCRWRLQSRPWNAVLGMWLHRLRRCINSFTAQCSGFMFSVLNTAQLRRSNIRTPMVRIPSPMIDFRDWQHLC
jgi:hypothetical protein